MGNVMRKLIQNLDFEKISLSMRFVLPTLIGLLLYIYHNDIQWHKQNFEEIKANQRIMDGKISLTIDKLDHKFEVHDEDDKAFRQKTEDRFQTIFFQCCSEAKPHGS